MPLQIRISRQKTLCKFFCRFFVAAYFCTVFYPLNLSAMDISASNGYMNGSDREVAPSFLFGERNNKRKAFALNGRPSGNSWDFLK
jgi:hypothetical protein